MGEDRLFSIAFQDISDKSCVLGRFGLLCVFKGHFSYINKEAPALC